MYSNVVTATDKILRSYYVSTEKARSMLISSTRRHVSNLVRIKPVEDKKIKVSEWVVLSGWVVQHSTVKQGDVI